MVQTMRENIRFEEGIPRWERRFEKFCSSFRRFVGRCNPEQWFVVLSGSPLIPVSSIPFRLLLESCCLDLVSVGLNLQFR
jgi:hypothetical protein